MLHTFTHTTYILCSDYSTAHFSLLPFPCFKRVVKPTYPYPLSQWHLFLASLRKNSVPCAVSLAFLSIADFWMTPIMAFLGEVSATVYVLPPPTTKRGAAAASDVFDTKSTSVNSLTDLAERTAALPTVTRRRNTQCCFTVRTSHTTTCHKSKYR